MLTWNCGSGNSTIYFCQRCKHRINVNFFFPPLQWTACEWERSLFPIHVYLLVNCSGVLCWLSGNETVTKEILKCCLLCRKLVQFSPLILSHLIFCLCVTGSCSSVSCSTTFSTPVACFHTEVPKQQKNIVFQFFS